METKTEVAEKKALKTDKTETFLTKFDDRIKYIEDRIVKL